MENTPGLEFEYYLADRLKMTVARLRSEMSNQEFIEWCIYHARRAQKQELEMKRRD